MGVKVLIYLPEQKQTIHMITQLRTETNSGAIDDLAHVVSTDMLSDCLTKDSAKPDELIKAVLTGILPNCDKHPPFRELMQQKHRAYLMTWLLRNTGRRKVNIRGATHFLGTDIRNELTHLTSSPFP